MCKLINHGLVMTLTNFKARSTLIGHICRKRKGNTSGNGQMYRIFMVILTLPWGYLFVYDHYSQTKFLLYSKNCANDHLNWVTTYV